jgi:hypothetical protein
MVRGHEICDPGDHGGGAEAVAGCARRIVFDIEHAGEGPAVGGPAAAVGEEEGCLCGAGAGGGVGKVVAAAEEGGAGGAGVVRGERGVDVAGAFGGLWGGVLVLAVGVGEGGGWDLDDDEAGTVAVGRGEVDVGLVVGDVEALDRADAWLKRGGCSACGQEEGKRWSEGELHPRCGD